jgi:hypothetical protein
MLPVVFLLFFVGGLALAVYAMLHGVERSEARHPRRPSPFFNAPTAAAFLTGAGATGYLIATHTSLSAALNLILSLIVGGAATGGMIGLLAGWALRKRGEAEADAEELQGQIALVTRAITAASPGEVFYTISGKPRAVPAESIDGIDIEAESEVVIESIENGIAKVELWSAVEERL